ETSRVGRRYTRGKHSMKKWAHSVLARGSRKQFERQDLWQRNLQHAKEVQREYEDNHAQCKNEIGVCELKSAPGHVAPGALKHNEKQRKPEEPREDSNRKRDTAPQNLPPALASLLNKSKDFQRNHWQSARHKIQHDAAQKTEEQKSEDPACGRCASRRKSRRG